VIVWNMQQKDANWALLRQGNELAADVHLLCESPRAHPEASRPSASGEPLGSRMHSLSIGR
jgi:hypothetical protein